jgi:hypothetical protein
MNVDRAKIGWTLWHPFENCQMHPTGPKRLQRVEQYIVGFGLGELEKWTAGFHEQAWHIESAIKRDLRSTLVKQAGFNSEIFAISPTDLKAIVMRHYNA